jgi:EAL domain-containing protein (putative c-di-GMP-specific phosphodiesterase class I)
LKSLPLSQLKIDQSFVRQIDDQNAAVIVETIIMMAQSLGLNVIAEGVENISQVEFLTAKGCLYFQGYYFSRPVPAEDFKFKL